jgi:DNA-binding NarL/FixJ family response regulator
MIEPYRVVLADDHMMFRLGMKKILEEAEDIEIVGEASDGHELLRLVNKIVPHMVIADISMPKIRGIEATREIKKIFPEIKIAIMTMHNNIEYLKHAISAGADAYVLKQDAGVELFSAIEAVRNGDVYISPVFSVGMADDFVKKCRGSLTPESEDLTVRQREVIKLIAEGKTSKEVADLLFISTRTVEKHRAAIMVKLNLKTIPDMVKYAIRKEYISMDND